MPATAAEEKMETEAGAAEEPAKAESMETGEAAAKTEETPAEGKPAENKTEAKVEKKEEEKGTKRKADEEPPFEVKENEPEIPEALVCLDWYNSDLNLRITDNYMTGIPFSRDGWGYCYAGARATYGFNSGKVWFEVKYLDNLDVKVEKDAVTFDLRVGWSSNKGSLMLGEDDKSWCYSSAEGKMAHMKTFEEYGEKFTKGDVVGAYIDFEGDEVSLTFTKNGEDQGDAFQIPKAELNGEALFPHIMARNVKFDVNFGLDKEDKVVEDWKEKLDGAYLKAGSVPIEQRVRGSARIATREECELVMMVGLPASGKTTWVEKATRSLQEMLRAASQRRRNVIIDQTNVYGNAQKRKSRPFEGFQRRAVVLVPCDEDYKARCKAQEDAGCKDIPDDAIMEMKANFALPEEDKEAAVPTFVEITFVEQYNKVAKEKGFGKKHEERKNKKFRGSDGTRPRGNFRGARGAPGFVPRGGRPMRGNFRGAPFSRGGRGGMSGPPMNMRGGSGPWMRGGRGGPMMPPRGGGGMGMGGPSPWSQGGNMGGGGGMGPTGWGPWNQGGGMNSGMGGGMGGG